jgi:cyclase
LLQAGADKVAINSAAVKNPDLINKVTDKIGQTMYCCGYRCQKNNNQSWEVFTHGGRNSTGIDVSDWSKDLQKRGAGEILLTSMDKDGTKSGFDIELLHTISKSISIPVIASGGAGTLEHLKDAIVNGFADAVLAASIFHYSIYTVSDVKDYLKKNGVLVRD